MLYETEAVMIAAGITTAIVFVLTIFAFQVIVILEAVFSDLLNTFQTKWDFTMLRGILVCVLFVFLIFGFIMIFVPQNKWHSVSS